MSFVGSSDVPQYCFLNAPRGSALLLALVALFILGIVMTAPMEPLVAHLVDQLDASDREDFEERAAIMEFEAMHSRDHAECLAMLDVLSRHPAAITGVTVMQVEIDGAMQWLLTTDIELAREHLAYLHGNELGVRNLQDVIDGYCRGIAVLTTAL